MKYLNLRRAMLRLRRNANAFLPALALALTLGTAVVTPPPPATDAKSSVIVPPTHTPLVNWNS